ncbi:MAG: hypothetical protein ACKOJC_03145 [Actinomycetota bacterium]
MAPFVAALVAVWSQGRWFPAGDMAQAELHMRGFLGHPPLVGAAGRIVGDTGVQGSHPGPSLWIAMLPIYLIGGRTSASLMASVVSVHIAAAVVALRLTWLRYGPVLTGMVALALVAIVHASGPDFVIEPWNPWLAIVPFLVFVLLVERCLAPEENRYALLGAVVVGSHCVQCHAGYAILVGVGLMIAAVYRVRHRGLRVLFGPLVALLAMWSPPLIDQMRREPGNLTLLWQHFGSPSEPRLPLPEAFRVVATQFNVLGPWLWGPGGSHPAESWFRWPGFVLFGVLFAGALMVARRRGWKSDVRFLTLLGSYFVVAVLSVTRLFGPYFEYTIRWAWILAAVMVALSLNVLGRDWVERRPSPIEGQRLAWLAVALALGASTWTSVAIASDVHRPGPTDSVIVGGLAPQLRRMDDEITYLVRFWDPYTLNATGFGIVLEMERSGYTVKVEPTFAAAALPHRTAIENEVDDVLWVVVGPKNDSLADDPALTRVAYFDPRTADERRRAESLLSDIENGLRAAGRDELIPNLVSPGASLLFAEPPLPDDVARDLRALYLLGQPVGVYSSAPGADVPSLG